MSVKYKVNIYKISVAIVFILALSACSNGTSLEYGSPEWPAALVGTWTTTLTGGVCENTGTFVLNINDYGTAHTLSIFQQKPVDGCSPSTIWDQNHVWSVQDDTFILDWQESNPKINSTELYKWSINGDVLRFKSDGRYATALPALFWVWQRAK